MVIRLVVVAHVPKGCKGAFSDGLVLRDYVLRIVRSASVAELHAEHHVIQTLTQQNLPFAMPVPLVTVGGALAVWLPTIDSDEWLIQR